MTTATDTLEKEFEALLEKNHLRAMQILQATLSMGVVAFAAVLGILYQTGEAANPRMEGSIFLILSGVHAAMALACWTLGLSAPSLATRFASSGMIPATGEERSSAAGRHLALIRSVIIFRLAFLEGSALLGLVICLLGILDGTLREKPVFWLNGLTAVLFLAYSAGTFPTRDRVLEMFRDLAGRLEEAGPR